MFSDPVFVQQAVGVVPFLNHYRVDLDGTVGLEGTVTRGAVLVVNSLDFHIVDHDKC